MEPAPLMNVGLQNLAGGRRRSTVPELIDEPIGRHRFICVEQQDRQERALLRRPHRNMAIPVAHADRPEDPVLHPAPPTTSKACCPQTCCVRASQLVPTDRRSSSGLRAWAGRRARTGDDGRVRRLHPQPGLGPAPQRQHPGQRSRSRNLPLISGRFSLPPSVLFGRCARLGDDLEGGLYRRDGEPAVDPGGERRQ
jgi:hypothetical protein